MTRSLQRPRRCVYVGEVHRASALLVMVSLAALFFGSSPRPCRGVASPAAPGQLVRVEPIGGYSHLVLRLLLWWQGFAQVFPTERGISLFRVEYGTTAPDGRVVLASGLLALPRGDAPWRGIVSWQHGTASLRTAAPSSLDAANGLLPAVVFAGHGYVLVAPDYLGFGVSTEPHAYYHTPSIVGATVDLLRASGQWLRVNDHRRSDTLLLAGFSQGGHATLATVRALEATPLDGLHVRGAASVAGPLDLAGVSLPESLVGRSRFASLYIAWIAQTYARVYGGDIASVLRPPWPAKVGEVIDGLHDGATVVAALPSQPRAMLADSFRDAVDHATPHWFLDRLRDNSLHDWSPRTPLRLYYGDLDVDVPHADAVAFANRVRSAGADVEVISVGAHDHDASVVAAAPRLLVWFDHLAQ